MNNYQAKESNAVWPYALFLILLFAMAIRCYGIDFGLPELFHHDEPFEMHRALRLANESFDFRRAGKGGFYYLLFFELSITFVLLIVTGKIANPDEFAAFYVQNEAFFYLGARIISACLGVATVYLIYILVRNISNKRTGLIAALFLSGSTLHAIHSHYATVDVMLVFLLMLTWLQIFSFMDTPKISRAILIGVFAGLSLATKLSAALIILPMATVVALGLLKKDFTFIKGILFSGVMFLTFIFVSLILEPGYLWIIIHFKEALIRIFGSQSLGIESTGNISTEAVEHNLNLYHIYGKTMLNNLGLPLLIAFSISFFIVMSSSPQIGLIFLSFLVPYFIAICNAQTDLFYARYLLPIIPLIYIITSFGLNNLLNIISKNIPRNKIPLYSLVVILLLSSLCLPQFLSTAKEVIKMNNEYSQTSAKKWIEANIKPGVTIHMEGNIEHRSQYDVPILNTDANIVQLITDLKKTASGKAKYWELRKQHINMLQGPRYNLSFTDWHDTYPTLEQLQNKNVDYLIININRLSGQNSAKIEAKQANSRMRFFKKLTESKQIHKLIEFNTASSQNGPPLAIYRL